MPHPNGRKAKKSERILYRRNVQPNANYGANRKVMLRLNWPLSAACFDVFLTACSKPAPIETARQAPAAQAAPKIGVAGDWNIIDSATFAVNPIHLGKRALGVHARADCTAVFDIAQNKVVRTLQAGSDWQNFCVSPDSRTINVNAENDGAIGDLDTVKNVLIWPISIVTLGQIKPLGMSSDASKLYVSTGKGKALYPANGPSNDVLVGDLATSTVLKKIPGRAGPWGLVVLLG